MRRLKIGGLSGSWSDVTCSVRYWISDNASTTGAALAFFCAFSIAPLLVILITLAGWVVGATAAYGHISVQLTSLFGAATAKTLITAARASQQSTGWIATMVSIGSLLLGATTILAALQSALEQIWKSEIKVKSGVLAWLRTRFLSLGFILALGFLLLISLTL
jgi:membrane protein